jgi:peptide/nickel transport system permease protein
VYTPRIARVARAAVLTVRHLEYVQAIKALGGHSSRILARHNLMGATLFVTP